MLIRARVWGTAQHLAEVLRLFRARNSAQMRSSHEPDAAPPWVPALETTDADWLSARLDSVLVGLTRGVRAQISANALTDEAKVSDADRTEIEGRASPA